MNLINKIIFYMFVIPIYTVDKAADYYIKKGGEILGGENDKI